MKPPSEKSYTEQALVNRKGVSWLDDCKIPSPENKIAYRNLRKQKSYGSGQVIGSEGEEWFEDPRGKHSSEERLCA